MSGSIIEYRDELDIAQVLIASKDALVAAWPAGLPRGMFTRAEADNGQRSLGVNAYLWHAALDTLSFLPIAWADPYGGVINSDWYAPPGVLNERLKVTVYITDRALRAEGLRVVVFRQTRNDVDWQYAPIAPDTASKLEDAILTRARELGRNHGTSRT